MTLLPIVERELRAAARRKSTYRIRFWTALATMAGFGWLMMVLGSSGAAGFAARTLFGILTNGAFGLCLLAGVWLTADCLSVEKREGTLGLLFLTDLKGYDVVLGKFTALALNPCYGLLAAFPVMAIPLLLGGVTGGEFWRGMLALANALFFSLAAGILVSALSRRARRATSGTFWLLLFLAGGPPALAWLASRFRLPPAWAYLAWISPALPFREARETAYLTGARQFWHSLIASQLLGWLFVALASLALPHCWQERPKAARFRPRLGHVTRRARERARWLESDPVLWLIGSNRAIAATAWIIALAWGMMVVAGMVFAPEFGTVFFGDFFFSRLFAFPLKVLFALETCRFFADARRDGALEMLLCTPLTGQEILQGQRQALRRTFMMPLALSFGLWFLPTVVAFFSTRSSGQFAKGTFESWAIVLACGRDAADFFAIYWFGTWLTLTAKKPQKAAPLTILFVLILPSFCCGLDIFVDILIILTGVWTLQQNFRRLIAQEYQRGPSNPASPVMQKLSPVPPVIPG